MKSLTALFVSAILVFAQDAPKTAPEKKSEKPPTVAELQKKLDDKEQQIQWMTQVINGLNAKLDALGKYYSANETLIRLDQIKPLAAPTAPAAAEGKK